MRPSWIFLILVESLSYSQSALCFVNHLKQRKIYHVRYMNKESNDEPDVANIKPPSSFDPSIFDRFDLGGWSTNVNNPFVAAAYVKARQSMDKPKPPKNRAENNRKGSSSNQDSSTSSNDDEQTTLQRLMSRDEQGILERRLAWERARAEENDD